MNKFTPTEIGVISVLVRSSDILTIADIHQLQAEHKFSDAVLSFMKAWYNPETATPEQLRMIENYRHWKDVSLKEKFT